MHIPAEQVNTTNINAATSINTASKSNTTPTSNNTDLFSSLVNSGTSSHQPDEVLSSLRRLLEQLSQQLNTDGDTETQTLSSNTPLSLNGATFSNISLVDTNQDGEFNEGDSLIVTLTDAAGADTEISIPLSSSDVSTLNSIISNLAEAEQDDPLNSEFMQAFMQGFIEMMIVNMYQAGKDLQDYLEKSQEDFSYEVSV